MSTLRDTEGRTIYIIPEFEILDDTKKMNIISIYISLQYKEHKMNWTTPGYRTRIAYQDIFGY